MPGDGIYSNKRSDMRQPTRSKRRGGKASSRTAEHNRHSKGAQTKFPRGGGRSNNKSHRHRAILRVPGTNRPQDVINIARRGGQSILSPCPPPMPHVRPLRWAAAHRCTNAIKQMIEPGWKRELEPKPNSHHTHDCRCISNTVHLRTFVQVPHLQQEATSSLVPQGVPCKSVYGALVERRAGALAPLLPHLCDEAPEALLVRLSSPSPPLLQRRTPRAPDARMPVLPDVAGGRHECAHIALLEAGELGGELGWRAGLAHLAAFRRPAAGRCALLGRLGVGRAGGGGGVRRT